MANDNPLKADAHHEAGHAVAAVVYGNGLVSVDIRPQRVPGGGIGRAGADFARPPDREILGRGEDAVMPYLVTFFAGGLAEKRVNEAAALEYGHRHSDGEMVRRYAIGAVCTPVRVRGQIVLRAEEQVEKAGQISAVIEGAQRRAAEFVVRFGAAIDAVAAELLKHERLSAAEVQAIVAANQPPSA